MQMESPHMGATNAGGVS